jgi:hypothetical protein
MVNGVHSGTGHASFPFKKAVAVFSLDTFAAGKPLPQEGNKLLDFEGGDKSACPRGIPNP